MVVIVNITGVQKDCKVSYCVDLLIYVVTGGWKIVN